MSGTQITVYVNRGTTDSLEAETESIETHRTFTLDLQGYERPAHVHCRILGDLDRIVSIDQSNYYLEPGVETGVPVEIDSARIDEPVDGQLEIVTGYGAESLTIDLTVTPAPDTGIDVDRSLSKPSRPTPEPSPFEQLFSRLVLDTSAIAVLALGAIAVAIATITAATIGGLMALIGLAIVGAGVLVALWLLLY
ncbi:hypothetical protein EA462_09760 [Natrarchaeobius halalkaliphilus]|uniref:Uncharacterized protein n=1 Tax=Natrarchaeobius halalkaliphilus TaxID=1679091 RepID=A0A3N6M9P0_9EURY|nr:hypothetical protein [Natrarchaeobius halalkaliphilus]RQG90256.1 hypothetical protein EA462_09760 [Natrarchaeobius halalkaliphilus]